MMRAILISLCLVLASGCATKLEKPKGDLLFSIRVTESAFGGIIEKKHGYFFYDDGQLITGYYLNRDIVIKTYVGDLQSSKLLRREIKKLSFVPFDFSIELHKAIETLVDHTKRGGSDIIQLGAFDGGEYEIRFIFENTDYTLRRWNPRPDIDFYSVYNPKISKLKTLLDLFASFCGKTKFDL